MLIIFFAIICREWRLYCCLTMFCHKSMAVDISVEYSCALLKRKSVKCLMFCANFHPPAPALLSLCPLIVSGQAGGSAVIKLSALNLNIVTKCCDSHKIAGIPLLLFSHVPNKIWIWREGVRKHGYVRLSALSATHVGCRVTGGCLGLHFMLAN